MTLRSWTMRRRTRSAPAGAACLYTVYVHRETASYAELVLVGAAPDVDGIILDVSNQETGAGACI